MAFVKLDTGILRSTLWMERDQCDIFLTALLMAEPKVFDEPQEQIQVDSLDLTGFVAPPGWYGFCPAAGVGIVRQSHTELEPGMEALRALGSPDNESRSKEFEGRRMIRVNGGYLILNYIPYREKDHTTADRSRRYRERKRETVTPLRHADTPLRHADTQLRHADTLIYRDSDTENVTVPRDITQAEAEAYKKRKQKQKPWADTSASHDSILETEADDVEFPEGLTEDQYAWRVLTAGFIPADAPILRRTAGSAIAMLAREEQCDMPTAAKRMLERVREAQKEGVQRWLQWFQDGEWRQVAEFVVKGPL